MKPIDRLPFRPAFYDTVVLPDWAIRQSWDVASHRAQEAMRNGRRNAHGLSQALSFQENAQISYEGTLGEHAVAQLFGVEWRDDYGYFKQGGDVGTLQVRTCKRHNGHLMIREDDNPHAVFFFVSCERLPEFRVHGWHLASDIMDSGYGPESPYWDDLGVGREFAWFVPPGYLRSTKEYLCLVQQACCPPHYPGPSIAFSMRNSTPAGHTSPSRTSSMGRRRGRKSYSSMNAA